MNVRITFLALTLVLMATLVMGQTRKIHHRSHSGSPMTFAMVMEEDHLGEMRPRMDMATYNVEPFVRKVRLHYEKLASKNPELRASLPEDKGVQSDIPAPDSASQERPGQVMPPATKGKHSKKATQLPAPQAYEAPSPDFLVQTQMRERQSVPVATTAPASGSGFSLLWGLLAFPILPGFFFASAWVGRRRSGTESAQI